VNYDGKEAEKLDMEWKAEAANGTGEAINEIE
jgi:hypothetical protein